MWKKKKELQRQIENQKYMIDKCFDYIFALIDYFDLEYSVNAKVREIERPNSIIIKKKENHCE